MTVLYHVAEHILYSKTHHDNVHLQKSYNQEKTLLPLFLAFHLTHILHPLHPLLSLLHHLLPLLSPFLNSFSINVLIFSTISPAPLFFTVSTNLSRLRPWPPSVNEALYAERRCSEGDNRRWRLSGNARIGENRAVSGKCINALPKVTLSVSHCDTPPGFMDSPLIPPFEPFHLWIFISPPPASPASRLGHLSPRQPLEIIHPIIPFKLLHIPPNHTIRRTPDVDDGIGR